MKLKRQVKSLDDVAEAFRSLYTEREGAFHLDVEADDPTEAMKELEAKLVKFGEFRDTNISRGKRIEELEGIVGKYKGINIEEYEVGQKLLSQIQDDKEREMIKAGKWEDVVKLRNGRMVEVHQTAIEAKDVVIAKEQANNVALRQTLGTMQVTQGLAAALNETGLRPRKSAMEDIEARTARLFAINEEGKAVPMRNGTIAYGEKGDLLTHTEHLQSLANTAPHLFEQGGGGGAEGGGGTQRTRSGKVKISKHDSVGVVRNAEGILAGTHVLVD